MSSTQVPEDEGPEDVGFDPAFMDWAKHWAENPKVQSAVLERTKAPALRLIRERK